MSVLDNSAAAHNLHTIPAFRTDTRNNMPFFLPRWKERVWRSRLCSDRMQREFSTRLVRTLVDLCSVYNIMFVRSIQPKCRQKCFNMRVKSACILRLYESVSQMYRIVRQRRDWREIIERTRLVSCEFNQRLKWKQTSRRTPTDTSACCHPRKVWNIFNSRRHVFTAPEKFVFLNCVFLFSLCVIMLYHYLWFILS